MSSSNLDVQEFERWFESAKRTIMSAFADLSSGYYNWSCFKAHQATEKGLKALLWGLGQPRVGHSLVSLLKDIQDLGVDIPSDIREKCFTLSKYYMITRYPDTWESGIPEDYFSEKDARDAISAANEILDWVRDIWQKLSK